MIASSLTMVYIAGGFCVMTCGGYICDVIGYLETMAYRYIGIFFYINILLLNCLCVL